MLLVDAAGNPLAGEIASASRHEVKLVEPLLANRTLQNRQPERLIYDKAADSDALRSRLGQAGVELICPHKRNRIRPARQDGRKLRRYSRRWKVERTIAWLHNFRRLVVRWEYHAHLFRGFLQCACMFTILRRF